LASFDDRFCQIFDFIKNQTMGKLQKTALITGANRGLGLETARQLAKKDIRVVVSARNEMLLQKTKTQFESEGLHADYVKLDVTDNTEIKTVADYIDRTYGSLDILINNAGISVEKSSSYMINNSENIHEDTLNIVYQTNVFGLIAVTQAMLPLLKKSSGGRIVNISSELGSIALHADSQSPVYHLKKFAYNSSKTIINQYTVHLAEKSKDLNIKVNAISPGWVKTDMGTQYAPLTVLEGVDIIVKAAMLPDDGPSGSFFTHKMKSIPW
jgi:NAD(P)-dependent dehydrogenase (short-subunit alcohol dehydrogenase family)